MVCLITNVQLYFPGMIFSQWRLPRGLPQTKFREIILVENYKYYRPGGGGGGKKKQDRVYVLIYTHELF